MQQKRLLLNIEGPLPNLREYIGLYRKDKAGLDALKEDVSKRIYEAIMGQTSRLARERVYVAHAVKPLDINFIWIRQNKKIDRHNVTFAKRYIFEELLRTGILFDKSWDRVGKETDYWEIGPKDRVIVFIDY